MSRPAIIPHQPIGQPEPVVPELPDTARPAVTLPGTKRAHHPFSLLVMGAWVCYIAVMVALLQHSAKVATRRVHQPWYYDWLPSVLLVGFAQVHLAVTALFLSRLAISALQQARTQPQSWAELLWLADRRWQSPMGVLTTLYYGQANHLTLSYTFGLFAITCLVAAITPVIVSRAWPVFTISVAENVTLTMDTFTPAMLSRIEFASQFSTGEGAWATGMSAQDIYSSSTYTPRGAAPAAADDFFFAGDVMQHDAVIPGVRVQGGCAELPGVAAPADAAAFNAWCRTVMPDIQSEFGLNFADRDLQANWWACVDFAPNNTDWMDLGPAFGTSAIVYFDSTNGQSAVSGYVVCNSTFATGDAFIDGRNLTFQNFAQRAFYDPAEEVDTVGNTLLPPLYSVLRDISQPYTVANGSSDQRSVMLMMALGYTPSYDASLHLIEYAQPPIATVATQLWRGTAHMAAAIAVLARAPNQTFPAVVHQSVSGRVADIPFIAGGAVLLLAWLVLLALSSALMYRRTFGGSLDIYIAARLLADRPHLMAGDAWDAAENKHLGDAFPRPEQHAESAYGRSYKLERPHEPVPTVLPEL